MNEDELPSDPFENVSGQLRKAVGQNRHEIGGLKSIISQMRRDRNKSVGLLSKQQQDFLQKQTRLLPAINFKGKSRTTSSQVIPLSHKAICSSKENHHRPEMCPITSTHFNVLPPIASGRNISRPLSLTDSQAKLRRISDYRKEFSSLQDSLNNAHRFASSSSSENLSNTHFLNTCKPSDLQFLQNENNVDFGYSDNFSKEFVYERKDNSKAYTKEQRITDVETIRRTKPGEAIAAVDHIAHRLMPEVNTTLVGEITEDNEGKQRNYWETVRQNLSVIAQMDKQSRSKYYDDLFQAIRRCRYIRIPKKKNHDTGVLYESEEEQDIGEIFESYERRS